MRIAISIGFMFLYCLFRFQSGPFGGPGNEIERTFALATFLQDQRKATIISINKNVKECLPNTEGKFGGAVLREVLADVFVISFDAALKIKLTESPIERKTLWEANKKKAEDNFIKKFSAKMQFMSDRQIRDVTALMKPISGRNLADCVSSKSLEELSQNGSGS
jgi:hypothetical protein